MKNQADTSMDIRDKIKSLAKHIKKSGDADAYKNFVDIQGEIFILIEENKKLVEEHAALKNEIIRLKEKLNIMKALKLENSVYWIHAEKGETDGPFCPNCWGAKEILVRMTTDVTRNRSYNKCPECMLVIRAKD